MIAYATHTPALIQPFIMAAPDAHIAHQIHITTCVPYAYYFIHQIPVSTIRLEYGASHNLILHILFNPIKNRGFEFT
jgi:hypothetical protein